MKTKAASKIAKKPSAAKKGVTPTKSASKPEPAKKAVAPAIEAPAQGTEKPAKANGKGALIMSMINGANGATLGELMEATGWQKHSIRGFISTASKKRGIESRKDEAGQRRYRLVD